MGKKLKLSKALGFSFSDMNFSVWYSNTELEDKVRWTWTVNWEYFEAKVTLLKLILSSANSQIQPRLGSDLTFHLNFASQLGPPFLERHLQKGKINLLRCWTCFYFFAISKRKEVDMTKMLNLRKTFLSSLFLYCSDENDDRKVYS